jgi:hypothetical protein
MMKEKLNMVRVQLYVDSGLESALTSLFAMIKGHDDFRMVFKCTLSSLNAALWAQWFCMYNVTSHIRVVEPGTFMADVDIGEMFMNFFLDPLIQLFADVGLTNFYPEELD